MSFGRGLHHVGASPLFLVFWFEYGAVFAGKYFFEQTLVNFCYVFILVKILKREKIYMKKNVFPIFVQLENQQLVHAIFKCNICITYPYSDCPITF